MLTKAYIPRSSGLYEKLIRLYPPAYRNKHQEELIQNFEDLQRDIGSRNFFWAFIISDLITSLGQQYMKYLAKHRWIQLVLAVLVLLLALATWQVLTLQKAHSSFDNYAAFRGCAQITSETPTSGTCTTRSGQNITIVQFDNRWFLQGDLPVCMIGIGSFCLIDQP